MLIIVAISPRYKAVVEGEVDDDDHGLNTKYIYSQVSEKVPFWTFCRRLTSGFLIFLIMYKDQKKCPLIFFLLPGIMGSDTTATCSIGHSAEVTEAI